MTSEGFHFKPATPRQLRPEEIQKAQIRTEAAVTEGLGSMTGDTHSGELSHENRAEALEATAQRIEEVRSEGSAAQNEFTATYAESAQNEFDELLRTKDNLSPEAQYELAELQRLVKGQGQVKPTSVLEVLKLISSSDMKAAFGESKALSLFSTELQNALEESRRTGAVNAEQRRILSDRAAELENPTQKPPSAERPFEDIEEAPEAPTGTNWFGSQSAAAPTPVSSEKTEEKSGWFKRKEAKPTTPSTEPKEKKGWFS